MNRILNISTSLFSFLRKVGLIVLCTLYSVLSFSQNFPVQVIPQALPPAPIYVSNYADASTVSSPLRVQIILNDFEIANREIRLKTYFTGSGLSFQSNDIVVGASPLFLEGGIPLILTNVELAPYFEFNNITGINASQYGNAIPEGAYQFCVEVYDVLTGSRLSNKSCAVSVVFQNEPPFLVLPRNKINVDETNPQYIVFQWTPRSINVSNVEYELSLVEIWDTQVDPQQAFLSSPPVFQTTTSATTYVYGPADPLLLSGKNYAWRIQAKAKQGIEEIGLFKNQGYSEIFSFSYAGACNLPLVINHEVKGSTNANIFWDDFSTEIPEFTIRYRQKNVQDAEWFLGKTTTNDHTIWDLKAGTTYEYQLSKNCGITQSDWSYTKEFTTALEFEEESVLDCGVSPDINLTNMQPLASIGTGATFKAGDFPVKILEVSGANGRFTGKGYVTLPYLKNIKVAVEFTNILINTDTEMAEGSVRTAYDADWGNILDTGDVVDVLDDVQDVFTGGDFTEYDVDFEINSANDIKIEGGEIIITGPNGETKTFDHDDGDTYQIKDASGDTYNVDEDGNITKGAEAAEGGEATAQNTDGISGGSGTADAPSVNEITANGVTVTFKKSSNTKYDLDIADSDFERSKYPKTQSASGTDYYPVHKAVVDGQTDEFLAEISISNSNISIDDLVVKTVSGLKIDTRKEENSNLIISLKGINSYRSEEAIVTYKDEEGKYKIAASFFIHHIKQQELVNVVVVSVNGTNQLANIEQELNSIFGKAGAQFKVSTDTFSLEGSDWDDNNNGKLDYDGSGLLSDYPKELKNIQQKYKQNKPSWDAKAYHLFLLPNNISLTKPLSGFMPKTRQWGYIFNAHTNDALENKSSQNLVAAHELGHGVFKLAHPFQNAENKSGSGSNWLMDYNNGDQLPYAHWAAMSDESLQLFLFQEEEDSEYTNNTVFSIENVTDENLTLEVKDFNCRKVLLSAGTVAEFSTADLTNIKSLKWKNAYMLSHVIGNNNKIYTKSLSISLKPEGDKMIYDKSRTSGRLVNKELLEAAASTGKDGVKYRTYFKDGEEKKGIVIPDNLGFPYILVTFKSVTQCKDEIGTQLQGKNDCYILKETQCSSSDGDGSSSSAGIDSQLKGLKESLESSSGIEFVENGTVYQLDDKGVAEIVSKPLTDEEINNGLWEGNESERFRYVVKDGILQLQAFGINKKQVKVAPGKEETDYKKISEHIRIKSNEFYKKYGVSNTSQTPTELGFDLNNKNEVFADGDAMGIDNNASFVGVAGEGYTIVKTLITTALVKEDVYLSSSSESVIIHAPGLLTGTIEAGSTVVTDLTSMCVMAYDLSTDKKARTEAYNGFSKLKTAIGDDPKKMAPLFFDVMVSAASGNTPAEWQILNNPLADKGQKSHFGSRGVVMTVKTVIAAGTFITQIDDIVERLIKKLDDVTEATGNLLSNLKALLKDLPKDLLKKLDNWKSADLIQLEEYLKKYADLVKDIKDPKIFEAVEKIIKNPESAWDVLKESDLYDTVIEKLGKSAFFKEVVTKGKKFEELISNTIIKNKEPFKSLLNGDFKHLKQIHLKGKLNKIISDDLFVKKQFDEILEIDYYRAVINDTKLTKNSPWTPNQKEELIDAFKNTDKPYIEFEVRSNKKALDDMDLPDAEFTTGTSIRIYKDDIYKIIGDGNGNFGETIQIFK